MLLKNTYHQFPKVQMTRVRLDRFIYKTLLTKTFLRGSDDEAVTTTEPPTNDN